MRRGLLLFQAVTLVLALGVLSSVAMAGGGNSANAKLCQKNGWAGAVDANGNPFANQDACVSYGAQGGTLTSCTLWGTSGDDILATTSTVDVICGFDGNDTVSGQ